MLSTQRYLPGEALLAAYRARGPMIDTGPAGYVLMLGPDANAFVFANAHAFSWQQTFEVMVPVDGPTALLVSDGAEHRRRRAAVQPALQHRRIAEQMPLMAAAADTVIDRWRPGDRVDAYRQFRAAIRRSTIEGLFGPGLGAHADALGGHLEPLLALTHLPPQVLPLQERTNSPGWRRAMAARARADALIYAEIARVRAVGTTGDGLLYELVQSGTLSDDEIRDQVSSLIAAGYETTSGALAFGLYALLSTPGVWDTAAAEVDRAAGGDITALPYLTGVVQETLRLYTPGVISARAVIEDLTFRGRRIRAGRMIVFSPYVTHRLPDAWPDPRRFEPLRWVPGAAQYRRASPAEFIPFSGGLHRCIGAALATTEMTVMLARVLARTRLSLPRQWISQRNFAALRPWPGLTVQVDARR